MRALSALFLSVPLVISCGAEALKPVLEADVDESVDTADGTIVDGSLDADGSPDTGDSGVTPNDTAAPSLDTADSAAPSFDSADSGSPADTASDTGDTGEMDLSIIDFDDDGFTELDGDCDDTDPTVYPDADELCDDKDNDCDAEIDEDAIDAVWSYADMDSDGYGDDRFSDYSCAVPAGYALLGGDCDDTSSITHPDAAERCDDIDNDCDVEIDEDVLYTWYADTDGDGYGDLDAAVEGCEPGPGYVATATDCDDTDPATNPGTYEICDGVDNNCDGVVDEDAVDATDWYSDADTDGFGRGEAERSCTAPDGYVATDGDCNDEDPAIHPDAMEVCDETDTDEDCSGAADDEDGSVVAATTTIWYRDSDDDGFGSVLYGLARCDVPTGYVADSTDCDDTDPSVYPDSAEICNGIDDDCDGDTDEGAAAGAVVWYADGDGDGFGDPETTADSCDAPDGYVADNTDCNDTNSEVNPEAPEWCNDIDDDCDSSVDEDDAEDAATWYADSDDDGFGDLESPFASCSMPDGHVGNSEDCDDSSGSVYPEAIETPDAVDEDCDGIIDEDTVAYDDDGDGYSEDDGDCDDAISSISPDAIEVCNGLDDNCDGVTDEDEAEGAATWFEDADDDGYGNPEVSISACEVPDGYTADDQDCNDDSPAINPSADEICDAVDNDCDGDTDESALDASTWFLDADDDGFGRDSITAESCSPPEGYTDNDADCDDDNPASNPLADELCDGFDNDCDGDIDDDDSDVVDLGMWYADNDGDGYGSADVIYSCLIPDGYTDTGGDCNDGDGSINPIAEEICGDGTDNDCDGATDETCPSYPHDNGQGVTWYNDVPTGTMSSEQAKLSCEQSHGTCYTSPGDCAGPGWCENPSGGKCWGWTSGCSGGAGRVWQQGSSYTTYGTWN